MTDLDDVPIGDVRTPMVRTAVARMRREATRPDGTPISARTVIRVYRTFALMFRTAVAEGVIRVNPCVLLPGDLPKKCHHRAPWVPKWRKGARFTAQELTAIVTDERIPHDRRMFYALLLLGGTRFGEAAALRWDAYDTTATPLGKLTIEASYSTKKRKEKTTKTDVAREMPVLPLLASLLASWKATGFAAMTGREPTPADLIVPSRLGRNRNANHMLRRFHQDLERLGMRVRRQHDARRTFISLAREGGASDLLKWATHGPGTEITDLYTTPDWASLCAEASKVNLAALPSPAPTTTDASATKDEEAEGVTTSTSPRRSQLGSPFAENPAFYGDSWRGGRDSNLSVAVENVSRRTVGRAVPRGISTVLTPPIVSTDNDSGKLPTGTPSANSRTFKVEIDGCCSCRGSRSTDACSVRAAPVRD